MPANVEEILEDALALSALERAALAEELLASLFRTEPGFDMPRAGEGEAEAIPDEDAFVLMDFFSKL